METLGKLALFILLWTMKDSLSRAVTSVEEMKNQTASEHTRSAINDWGHIVSGSTLALKASSSTALLVRLVNGAHPGEGRVEVMVGGIWGTACDKNFEINNALVVCRMMGYSGVQPVIHRMAYYGQGTGNIWLKNVQCRGSEKHIFQCPIKDTESHTCNHSNDVGVNCVPSVINTIRLANGPVPWEGRVEVWYNGIWGTVCDDGFDVKNAVVVCRMLGYTGVQPFVHRQYNFGPYYGPGSGTIWLDDVSCLGTETNIFHCWNRGLGVNNCGHIEDVGVNCQPALPSLSVRLVNGVQAWEGRVEVLYERQWGTVCHDQFDVNDARVICKMLGYSAETPAVLNAAYYGQGTGNIWLDDVNCRGTELTIFLCQHRGLGTHNCEHSQDVGVNCQPFDQLKAIRLADGAHAWEGRVEVWNSGTWGTVCNDLFGITDARVVCWMMGFPGVQPSLNNYGQGSGTIWLDDVQCRGWETNIFRCLHRGLGIGNCSHKQDVGLNCQPSAPTTVARLSNGPNPWEGRVEVWNNGSWGTVCDENFDVIDAGVVCKMLSYTDGLPIVHHTSVYGQGSGPIWLDDLECDGNERNIFLCLHNGLGVHNCDHSKDVGVNCRSPMTNIRTTTITTTSQRTSFTYFTHTTGTPTNMNITENVVSSTTFSNSPDNSYIWITIEVTFPIVISLGIAVFIAHRYELLCFNDVSCPRRRSKLVNESNRDLRTTGHTLRSGNQTNQGFRESLTISEQLSGTPGDEEC